MSRRKVNFTQGGYYHIYNRGANRERIFQSDENYRFLLQRVKENISPFQVSVIAYCLMPNHYHFVLRQEGEKPLSGFMHAIFNSYSKAYNKMYNRSGTLFEERFKAIEVDRDEYLLHLCRYVHRNPLDAKVVSNLKDWKFSNYLEWIGKRNGVLVDHEFVREFFKTPMQYIEFVHDYFPPKELEARVRQLAGE